MQDLVVENSEGEDRYNLRVIEINCLAFVYQRLIA
jgi:hypothetical protein